MSNTSKAAPKKPTQPELKPRPAPAASHKHPKPGLGRGLGALISHHAAPSQHQHPGTAPAAQPAPGPAAAAPATDPKHTVFEVPVAEIARSPWQPRQTFDEEALRELADSIRANGVIQPLICRRNAEGRFELIAGERRLRAAIEAKLAKVPVILVDAEDRRAAEMAIIENIQRQDLNVIEEAEGYRTLA